tara:strand:- start:8 stop:259 length:252 start_codon:yes stop_codon:yes gene_type:complete
MNTEIIASAAQKYRTPLEMLADHRAEIATAIKAGRTVTAKGRKFFLLRGQERNILAMRVSNGGLTHASREDIMNAVISHATKS